MLSTQTTTHLLLLVLGCTVATDNVFDHKEEPTANSTVTRRSLQSSSSYRNNVVQFYALSDSPFGTKEREKFPAQLQNLESRPDFIVHLGNVRERQQECNEEHIDIVADALLQNSKLPTFVVPGDSDWYNCLDQNVAWQKWKDTFGRFQEKWPNPFQVSHQKMRQENFFFMHKGVLFVSFHVLSSSVLDWDIWNALVKDNVEWLEHALLTNAFSDQVGAIVMLAHAQPHLRRYRLFYEALVSVTSSIDKPMLYLHGDEHVFGVNEYLPGVKHLMRVSVAQGGDEGPLQVTVDPFGEVPFSFRRRKVVE
jgi:hypothetical protein